MDTKHLSKIEESEVIRKRLSKFMTKFCFRNSKLEGLMNTLIPFAQQALEKYGEFYPIAATMDEQNKITLLSVHTGDEHPESITLITEFEKIIKSGAKNKKITGAAICFDVRLKSDNKITSDAIQVDLEHATEGSITILLPYTKLDTFFDYGEITVQEKKKTWF